MSVELAPWGHWQMLGTLWTPWLVALFSGPLGLLLTFVSSHWLTILIFFGDRALLWWLSYSTKSGPWSHWVSAAPGRAPSFINSRWASSPVAASTCTHCKKYPSAENLEFDQNTTVQHFPCVWAFLHPVFTQTQPASLSFRSWQMRAIHRLQVLQSVGHAQSSKHLLWLLLLAS